MNSTVGTISFWMQSTNVTPTPNPYAIIFDRRNAGGDVIYQAPNGHLANQAQQSGAETVNTQTTGAGLTDGQWHHVAYVYDQASQQPVSFYVDGVLDTTAINSQAWFWVATQEIEIGSSHTSFWSGYTGYLDDFRIYNRPLSASEVADLAGLGTGPIIGISARGQPTALTVGVKDTPSFTVTPTIINGNSALLAYQWLRDGTNIVGATNASYPLIANKADSGAQFQAQLSYPGALNVTSAPATLAVVPEVVVVYSFDAAPINNVIVDSSTNTTTPHHGVNFGATWVASEDGRQGVMLFNAAALNQIKVAAASDLDLSRGTIAFWMQSSNVTQTPNPYAILFDRRAQPSDNLPSSGGDVIYQAPDGHLANQAQAPGTVNVNSQETVFNSADSQWHHIAYCFDQNAAGSVSFYVDGALDSTRTNTAPWAWVSQEEIEIGKSHFPFWAAYNGYLDDFRIYNRVLSASEIAQLAGRGLQPAIVISSQPVNLSTGLNDQPTLSVIATVSNGDPAKIGYQWSINGTNLIGATNASYSFPVSANDNGANFQVQLSYPGATSLLSSNAMLTVLPEFVLHFAFDTAPQNNVIVDSSPVGTNNGANVGAAWVASQDGRTNVVKFDPAVPGQITIPASASLNSMRGTIAFWMESSQVTLTPNPNALLFDRRAMPADGVPLTGGDVIYQLPTGNLADQAEVGGRSRANTVSTLANPTDGKWHHVAYVYDQTPQGFVGFYIDGALDRTQNNSQSWYWVPNEELELGKSHYSFWSAYAGFLSDFRIYNRVLSAAEISQLAGLAVPEPALVFSLSGGNLILSWSNPGFVLQKSSSLNDPSGWTNIPNGNLSPVVVSLPSTGASFFRLTKP